MYFWVNSKDTVLGEFLLNVTGDHNALNALAAIIVCMEIGLSISDIKSSLSKFMGTRRRFEYIKDLSTGAVLYDDYAHHPTEIKSTLSAFRKTFPNKKILCIFQPHTYSRTKKLFDQFKYSLSLADEVIIADIYSSEREEKDDSVSSQMLANEITKIFSKVKYVKNLPDMVKYVNEKAYNSEWVVVTMGAGNIYKIAEDLI
jgi:UDP-N-acetylmuramate--alanine ligase